MHYSALPTQQLLPAIAKLRHPQSSSRGLVNVAIDATPDGKTTVRFAPRSTEPQLQSAASAPLKFREIAEDGRVYYIASFR